MAYSLPRKCDIVMTLVLLDLSHPSGWHGMELADADREDVGVDVGFAKILLGVQSTLFVCCRYRLRKLESHKNLVQL